MEKVNGNVTMTDAEFQAALQEAARQGAQAAMNATQTTQAATPAEPEVVAEPAYTAPTELGNAYHDWRAERDREAENMWNELADVSPFGGGLCRLFGNIAGGLARHHERKGFFGRKC